MWVISKFPGYQVKLRGEDVIYAPNGAVVKRQPRLRLVFRPGYFPEWAHEQAKKRWPSPPGAPDSMLVPRNLYGGLETRSMAIEMNWSEEDLEFIEDKIRNWRPRAGTDWFIAEEDKLAAPWPGYKTTKPGKLKVGEKPVATCDVIVDLVVKTGTDPAEVLAYERQEFGDSRPEVLDALERLIAGTEKDEAEELVTA